MPLTDPLTLALTHRYTGSTVTYDTIGPFPAPSLLAEITFSIGHSGKSGAIISPVLSTTPTADTDTHQAAAPLLISATDNITGVPAFTTPNQAAPAFLTFPVPLHRPVVAGPYWILVAISVVVAALSTTSILTTVTVEPLTTDLRDAMTAQQQGP